MAHEALRRLRELMAIVERLEEVPLPPHVRADVARLRPAIMAYADAESERSSLAGRRGVNGS